MSEIILTLKEYAEDDLLPFLEEFKRHNITINIERCFKMLCDSGMYQITESFSDTESIKNTLLVFSVEGSGLIVRLEGFCKRTLLELFLGLDYYGFNTNCMDKIQVMS